MTWLRKTLYGLVVVALLAATGFALYAIGRSVLRYWGALVWWVYVIGAVLYFFLGAILTVRFRRSGNWDLRVMMVSAQIVVSQQSKFTRLRMRISRGLRLICTALSWPGTFVVSMLRGAKARGAVDVRTAAVLSQLSADDLRIAPVFILVLLILVLGAMAVSRTPSPHALLFCGCVAAYVSLFCVDATVSPTSVAERLRRASGHPYKNAVVLALVMAVSLIGAYAALIANGPPRLMHVDGAIRGLYSQLDSVKQVLRGERIATLTLAEGISGALVISALIDGLLSLKDFKRVDDDFVALAQIKLQVGRAAEAADAIRRVRNPSVTSATAEAVALLGVGQIDRAIKKWPHQPTNDAAPIDEEVRLRAFLQAALSYPLPYQSTGALLKRWLQLHPPEKFVCGMLGQLLAFQRAGVPQLLSALTEAAPDGSYPVATATMKLRNEELEEALAVAEAAPASSGALEFIRVSTVLLARITNPKTDRAADRDAFEAWCGEHLGRLTEIGGQLNEEFDLALAVAVATDLEKIATIVDSGYLEGARFLGSTLVVRLNAVAPNKDAAQIMLRDLLPNAVRVPKL